MLKIRAAPWCARTPTIFRCTTAPETQTGLSALTSPGMVSLADYVNIGFYLCFIVGVSVYFLRRSKNTSDYFRGGGTLP